MMNFTKVLLVVVVALLLAAPVMAADLIDFSGYDPEIYNDNEVPDFTLSFGPTVSISELLYWGSDPDHTGDPGGDQGLVAGSDELEDPAVFGAITFSAPVEVPSFWITSGPYGSYEDDVIKGLLDGSEIFSVTILGPDETWQEVTAGAGQDIDTLKFWNYQSSEVDDVTVVPEPATLALLGLGGLGLLLRRKRR